jgi:hypothetical protein
MRYYIGYSLMVLVMATIALLDVWQSWQFRISLAALQDLENKQMVALEHNKRLQASITALSAPERLLILVEQNPQWQLRRLMSADVTVIEIERR